MSEPTGAPRPAGAVFWAAVLAFLVVDLGFYAAPLARFPALVQALSYALLGALAVALAFVVGVALDAVRRRRAPRAGDVVRSVVLLAVVGAHLAALVGALRRR